MEIELLIKELGVDRILLGSSSMPIIERCVEIAVGAEARIYRCRFMGIDSVVKVREPKPYIMREIDAALRAKRVKVEAKAMARALELGVKVPLVLWVDVDKGFLIMEYIDGALLREYLKQCSDEEACRYMTTFGEYLSKLHSSGLVHGDPTTSNAVVSTDGELYLIDFGLAEFSEVFDDYAIDVHIAFRAIESTHFDRENLLKRCFIQGYSKYMKESDLVLKRVEEIRLMGRYVERRKKTVWEEQ